MTSRTRNFAILGVVAILLVLAALVIVPGSPLSKDTKLGLDLEGGIELVYEGRPTPQVPEVTPQAVDDAIETMRKRVDALGVSEPEIQRSGAEQISVGLPDVTNAERAREQVGTTAQLQFYDWEPNLLTDTEVYSGGDGLYDATLAASKEKGKAEQSDVVPGSGDTPRRPTARTTPRRTATTCSVPTRRRSAPTSSRFARRPMSPPRPATSCLPSTTPSRVSRTSTTRTPSA